MSSQVSNFLTNEDQVARGTFVNPAFARDDFRFQLRRGVIEINCHESLTSRLLKVLEYRLIPRVIRDHQHKACRCIKDRSPLLDGQAAAVISQRMNDHHRILSCFDYLVEITDCSVAHSGRKWTVMPDRFF